LDELLFGQNINSGSYGFSDSNKMRAPILLKPHGSLNWFEAAQGSNLKAAKRTLIFGKRDSSEAIYAFKRFREPISTRGRTYTPLIVPPVYLKNFKKPVFKALWQNCTATLSTARKVIFLGYSMPQADLHAQFIMRCGFHNQIEGELSVAGKRKEKTGAATVIVVNPDQGAARRIAAVAGPKHECKWISTPVADWIDAH